MKFPGFFSWAAIVGALVVGPGAFGAEAEEEGLRFLQPLICSRTGNEFCTELKAADNVKEVSAEIFRFDIMAALKRGLPVDYGNIKREDFGSLGFALKFVSKESACKLKRQGEVVSFNLGKIPQNGTYLIRACAGSEEAYQLFSVSDIGLVSLNSPNREGNCSFWISNLKTGTSSVPDRAVKYTAQSGIFENGVNIGGGGLIDAKSEKETVLYAFRKGEQTALCLIAPEEKFSKCWLGFLTCESRTLQPGQNLRYRAVLRKLGPYRSDSGDAKEIFEIELRDSKNKLICSDKTALDFDSGINGILKIPKELEDVSYTLALKDSRGGMAASYEFVAGEASDKQLSLTARSDKTFYEPDGVIVLELDFRDKDKLPLGGVDLQLTAEQCEVDFADAYGYGCLGMRCVSAFKACPLDNGLIKTDASGKAVFKLKAESLNLNDGKCHSVRFNISSEDGKAAALCSVILAPKAYHLHIGGGEELCAGDRGNFYIQFNDWQGIPLKDAEADVCIADANGKALQNTRLKTDERGQAAFACDFAEGGSYTVRAEIKALPSGKTEDSVIEGKRYLTVGGKAAHLHLAIKNSFCRVGEEAEIKTELPTAGGDVLLVLENSGFYRRYVIHTGKGENSFKIPVKADMFPFVNVKVYCLSGGRLYEESRVLNVFDPERFIKLESALESLPVKGRNGRIKVRAFDVHGNPVRGRVQLALINTENMPFAADENFIAAILGGSRQRGLLERTNICRADSPPAEIEAEPAVLFSDYRYIDLGGCPLGEDGIGEAEAEMPDLQGKWTLLSYTVTDEGYIGFDASDINIFDSVELTADGPSVLNGGDFAEFKIKLHNTGREALRLQVGLRTQKENILHLQLKSDFTERGGSYYSPEFDLAPGGKKEFGCIVKGGLPGADNIVVEVKGGNGADKYQMPVVIQPMVTVYNQNLHDILKNETVLEFDKFKPEYIGRVFDRSLNLEMMNGLGGVLALNAENLLGRETDDCTDFVIAAWTAPSLCASAFAKNNIEVPESMKLSPLREENCRRLLASAQNSDGGFAWYRGLKSDPNMTAWTLFYLKKLKNSGVTELDEAADRAERYLRRSADQAPLNRRMLYSLALPDLKFSESEIQKIERMDDAVDNAAILSYLHYLVGHGQKQKAKALWSFFAERLIKEKELVYCLGGEVLSDCQATALALWIGSSLELPVEELEPLVNWLMGERENGLWGNYGDTLAALEALAQLMYRDFSPPDSPSYGIWINGNEIETGDGLNDKNLWYRSINLKVSQLPDSNLRVKLVKNGKEKIWVDAYESLVVHGLKEAGYFNNMTGETVGDPAKAPFFIENGWQALGKKDKHHFVKEGAGGSLSVRVISKVDLSRVRIKLPHLGGFTADKLQKPEGPDCVFDSLGGCIYIYSLPKGEYSFKVDGTVSECGEFTASPARLQSDGNPNEYAQAEPFAVTAERVGK